MVAIVWALVQLTAYLTYSKQEHIIYGEIEEAVVTLLIQKPQEHGATLCATFIHTFSARSHGVTGSLQDIPSSLMTGWGNPHKPLSSAASAPQ